MMRDSFPSMKTAERQDSQNRQEKLAHLPAEVNSTATEILFRTKSAGESVASGGKKVNKKRSGRISLLY